MSDCDRRWEVDVYREGRLGEKDADSFERHLRVCRDCRRRNECDERLRMLARALPDDGPSELTLRRLRTRVLRDVATGAPGRDGARWLRVAVAAGVVVALAGGLGVMRGAVRARAAHVAAAAPAEHAEPLPTTLAGTVGAVPGARWAQVRDQGVERVTLDEGTVTVHVRHQTVGERFLVMLPDGEIEVRGTTFDVTVDAGATREVHVDEGIVELRLRGRPVARLGAGETWDAPAQVVAEPAVSARPAPAAARPAGSSAPAIAPADDGATAYARAIQLLREGRPGEAAAAFHALAAAHPGGPQAEDASFLEAVALARAGRLGEAADAAEHHLATFPSSFHRKEAALLVARAASGRGDCVKARSVLAPWSGRGDAADVSAALGACAAP